MASSERPVLPARREVMVLMFTDVVGSTTSKTRIGTSRFEQNLTRHDELFGSLMAGMPGAEILRETGDGFFARFPRASDAILLALRFQDLLYKERWHGEPLEVKIGIHQGEALQRTSYVGEPLKIVGLTADLAARLTALANPRQILLSRAAFDDALQFLQGDRIKELPYSVRWHSHGMYTLLGSQELPMEVLQVGNAVEGDFSPPRTPRATEEKNVERADGLAQNRHSPSGKIKFVHRLAKAAHWQERKESDQLRAWWKSTNTGLCALVGIGGAGKTSIVDRFLWQLPSVMPPRVDVLPDESLDAPDLSLIFSFFEAPTTDEFLVQLARWLGSIDVSDSNASYHRIMEILEQPGPPRLIVLDGFEKAQEEGVRGGCPGKIQDARLRDLILRVADGAIPDLRMIITSRFQLFDAIAHACPLYHAISVEDLSSPAAKLLLRARGVQGTDAELEALAGDYRFHALSIDLLGGYLKRYANGKPLRTLQLSEKHHNASRGDTQASLLRMQEERFEDITERYRGELSQHDPATLKLLEMICLFRLGVTRESLAAIFLGSDKEGVSGHHLAMLSTAELEERLHLLVELGLVESASDRTLPTSQVVYSTHPAVRDSFLRGLQTSVQRTGHAAVSQYLLSTIPGSSFVLDARQLDLVEETMYHALSAGQIQEAWRLYSHDLGGYDFLGRHLGLYKRGERLCRMLLKEAGLRSEDRMELQNELSLYLRNVGSLTDAVTQQRENLSNRTEGSRAKELQILAQLECVVGHLRTALETAEQAVAEAGERPSLLEASLAIRAQIHALRGNVKQAYADFEAARQYQEQIDGTNRLYALRGVQYAQLLHRMNRHEDAQNHTLWNRSQLIRLYGAEHQHVASCDLLLATLSLEQGRLDEARQSLAAAYDWAVTRDAHEPICQAAAIKTRIALAEFAANGHRTSERPSLAPLETALRLAQVSTLGLLTIDLLLVRAQYYLAIEEHDRAIDDAYQALYGAIATNSPNESHSTTIQQAACHIEVQYIWAELVGCKHLGEAWYRKALHDSSPQNRHSFLEALRFLEQSQTKEGQLGLAPDHFVRSRIGEINSRLD